MSSATVRNAFNAAWPAVIGDHDLPLIDVVNNAGELPSGEFATMLFAAESTRGETTDRIHRVEDGDVTIAINTARGIGGLRGAVLMEHIADALITLSPLGGVVDVLSIEGPADSDDDASGTGLHHLTTAVVRYQRVYARR